MDLRYEAYCFADPLFFDEQRDADVPGGSFAQDLPAPPDGWLLADQDVWRMLAPTDRSLPRQRLEDSRFRPPGQRGPSARASTCVLYAHLGSSRKFITIDPVDEAQLEVALTELGAALTGSEGLYILRDLRWSEGPMYVRYGGSPSGLSEAHVFLCETEPHAHHYSGEMSNGGLQFQCPHFGIAG